MHPDFRSSMAWLHTWAGVILGSLMFVIFFFGTLSVFKHEIDQWMLPQTRMELPEEPVSIDAIYDKIEEEFGRDTRNVIIGLPSSSFPAIDLTIAPAKGPTQRLFMDPQTLEFVTPQDSAAARNFLYPMHYRLTPMPYGRWVSAAIAMIMLAMFVSGIVIHRKIFVDFFTFRPGKKLPRSSLDLHNLTSVVAMPFHILITVTGVLILFSLYFEPSLKSAYPDAERPRHELRNVLEGIDFPRRLNAPNPERIVSIDELLPRASPFWNGAKVASVRITHAGDQGGDIWLYKSFADQVSSLNPPVIFSAVTGDLKSHPIPSAAYDVQNWLAGTHQIFFKHWVLRWLYFFAGFAGCIMIATGFIYWMETRRKIYQRNNWPGVRVVEGLAVWGVMGAITATGAMLIANRLFEPGLWSWNGIAKPQLEIMIFNYTWLACAAHGWIRGKAAWGEQAWLIAGLALSAVLLNWATTGDHLIATLSSREFGIAGMDLVLIGSALISFAAAWKITRGVVMDDTVADAKRV